MGAPRGMGALSGEESRGTTPDLGCCDTRNQCSLAGSEHAANGGIVGRAGQDNQPATREQWPGLGRGGGTHSAVLASEAHG